MISFQVLYINFLQSALRSISYFFHTQVNSDCSNMKDQNTCFTKFKIMKLKIDAYNAFIIFLTTAPKIFWIDFVLE